MPPSAFGKTQVLRLSQLPHSPMNSPESLSSASTKAVGNGFSFPAIIAEGLITTSNSSQYKAGFWWSF
jgi:hypothetical protein